jgi:antitoxin (DNA-binding transcriptional repressor) of toxin-antitoxin stability system
MCSAGNYGSTWVELSTSAPPMPSGVLPGTTKCDTMGHMKTISIRELHLATGRWVRKASAEEVYVTERGRLVAKIVPASPPPAKPFFASPRYTRAFLAQRKHLQGGTDSTKTISEERDREVE